MGDIRVEDVQPKMLYTTTSQVQVKEYQTGEVEIVSENRSIRMNPSLLNEEEALVLADTLLRVLGLASSVLLSIRKVYTEPAVEGFVSKYRRLLEEREWPVERREEPETNKVEETVEEIVNLIKEAIKEDVSDIRQEIQGLKSQTRTIATAVFEKE